MGLAFRGVGGIGESKTRRWGASPEPEHTTIEILTTSQKTAILVRIAIGRRSVAAVGATHALFAHALFASKYSHTYQKARNG